MKIYIIIRSKYTLYSIPVNFNSIRNWEWSYFYLRLTIHLVLCLIVLYISIFPILQVHYSFFFNYYFHFFKLTFFKILNFILLKKFLIWLLKKCRGTKYFILRNWYYKNNFSQILNTTIWTDIKKYILKFIFL